MSTIFSPFRTLTALAVGALLVGLSGAGRTQELEMDLDGDGVPDDADNCLEFPNPDQLDQDHDGYGSLCDADYNQDGVAGIIPDFMSFKGTFGANVGDFNYLVPMDHDGDGAIGLNDFSVVRRCMLRAVGPSGLACAADPPVTGSCVPLE
jgi:hypothetical protein